MTSDVKKTMEALGITYAELSDGTICVPGTVDLFGRDLKELPDLSEVVVMGSFDCSHNNLTSLKGAPKEVRGNFICSSNRLVTLCGAPHEVMPGYFNCTDNESLKNLYGAPRCFRLLASDLGQFESWDKIPYELRTDEARIRKEVAAIVTGSMKSPVKMLKRIYL